MRHVFLLLLSFSAIILPGCAESPMIEAPFMQSEVNSWVLKINTGGGMGGLGEGGWIIDSMGNVAVGTEAERMEPYIVYRLDCKGVLSDEDLKKISHRLASNKPSEWRARYVDAQYPGGYADGIGVSLVLVLRMSDGSEKTYTTSWDDASRNQLPESLYNMYEETRMLKWNMLKKCKSQK